MPTPSAEPCLFRPTGRARTGRVSTSRGPVGPPPATIDWTPCAGDADAQCGTLSVPADWSRPHGPRIDVKVARRPATDRANRVGSMVFGPGGPGDSGVERVVKGMSRFSDEVK